MLFIPSIVYFIANILILGSMDMAARLSLVDQDIFINGSENNPNTSLLIGFWVVAILLVFAQIALVITKVSKIMILEAELMQQQPSHLAYLEWRWIIGISISVLIFLVLNVIIEMIVPMKHIGLVIVYNLLMLVTGGLTGYLGMKQDTLLNQVEKISNIDQLPGEELVENHPGISKDPAAGNLISPEEAEAIHRKILEYLAVEKPYVKSDFSMNDLCNSLNINRRKVSYVMNDVIRKNFYGVINEYRVKEAEELLLKDEMNQMKIEFLGEMVGFQSKSSFNACFKKVTGMTPSEYRVKKRAI
jgi:AraC-like DNA-binding protein